MKASEGYITFEYGELNICHTQTFATVEDFLKVHAPTKEREPAYKKAYAECEKMKAKKAQPEIKTEA